MSVEKATSIDLSLIKDSFSKYIVSPLNAFGLGGFVFDIEGDTTINLNAEITDHYIENNNAIQDHIAIKPQKISLHNYVGEVVYRLDNSTNTPVQKLTQKLTILNEYVPILSAAATQTKSLLESKDIIGTLTNSFNKTNIQSTISSAASLWENIKNLTPTNSKQQKAYMFFKALFEQKILVSLQTPFEFISNLAIESITAMQTEDTKYISDFSITLKKIRTVSSATVAFNPNDFFGKAATQIQGVINQGNTQGQTVAAPTTASGYESLMGLR